MIINVAINIGNIINVINIIKFLVLILLMILKMSLLKYVYNLMLNRRNSTKL